jgi:hypothetical protein
MSEWALALQHMGHSAKQWDRNEKPLFDEFDENQPDVFITSASDLTPGQIRCFKEFDDTKVVINVKNQADFDERRYKKGLFFSFHEYINDPSVIYLPRATNWNLRERMQGVSSSPDYQCDISIICDYSEEIQKYVIPLLNTEHRLRIYGANWPLPQCVGRIPWEDRFFVYFSSKIVLDSPQDKQTFFDVFACGGTCISPYDEKESLKLVNYWIDKDKPNVELQESILQKDTYQKRIEKLIRALT